MYEGMHIKLTVLTYIKSMQNCSHHGCADCTVTLMCRREKVQKDTQELDTSIARLRSAMGRLNSKLADTKAKKAALEEDIFSLQAQLEQASKVQATSLRIGCHLQRDLPSVQRLSGARCL